ncbi:hypothetical protein EST38_g423 [Candolleomyces aberdarensis]|uniref:1-acyl-sn-glycerol-3-phosphate acyltransferase n=1 Tax=Candolleomyces aberdarensis TaxID=2316362 RepID=A0A4Q2DXK4_9AGAR|nr:hypothetical protein EST38_g423 [Candolleomyces aberdarensis]
MSFIVSLFKPLAYLSLPILFLRSLAGTSPLARYYIRAVAYAGTLVTVASGCIVAAVGFTVVGKQHDVNHFVARVFYATVTRLFGITVELEGEEHLNSRPAILMANHQSMLDVIILGRVMPKQTSIISKESIKYSPLGPFMLLSGTIFINRGNNAQAVKSLNDAGNLIKKNKISTWIFPEGTRHLSAKSDMLPLKKGGFHLAVAAGIPIIPIVVENYYHIYHSGVFGEGKIKVKVLPPIATVGLTSKDAGELSVRVREQMLETLHEISTHAVKPAASEKVQEPVQEPLVAPEVISEPVVEPASPSTSSAFGVSSSTASIVSSLSSRSSRASENGAETEEDEGMILVGRPSN